MCSKSKIFTLIIKIIQILTLVKMEEKTFKKTDAQSFIF